MRIYIITDNNIAISIMHTQNLMCSYTCGSTVAGKEQEQERSQRYLHSAVLHIHIDPYTNEVTKLD